MSIPQGKFVCMLLFLFLVVDGSGSGFLSGCYFVLASLVAVYRRGRGDSSVFLIQPLS